MEVSAWLARIGRVFSSAAVADVVGEVRGEKTGGFASPVPERSGYYQASLGPQTRLAPPVPQPPQKGSSNCSSSPKRHVVYANQHNGTAVSTTTTTSSGTRNSKMGSKRIYDRHLAQFVYSCSPSRGCNGYRYLVHHSTYSSYQSSRMEENTADECYRSINHAERMMRKMETYHTKGQLCDVTLIVGQHRIHGHRIVLSAASDYFAAMFTNDVKEATQEEVKMKDVDPEALSSLVNYMYTGECSLIIVQSI